LSLKHTVVASRRWRRWTLWRWRTEIAYMIREEAEQLQRERKWRKAEVKPLARVMVRFRVEQVRRKLQKAT
jgi:hypothetical protein